MPPSASRSEPESPAAAPPHPVALHLRPTADLAERVLLPGDPGRALALAQTLIETPRMFNHHRGLWGYSGRALADGEPLTIQATGMGGPSAAIVLSELIALGARRAVRVGTCGALDPELGHGELVIASEALCHDGTSRALAGGAERVAADAALTGALAEAADTQAGGVGAARVRLGGVVSVDLFYADVPSGGVVAGARTRAREHPQMRTALPAFRAPDVPLAVEMESATLFAIGARAGISVGCVLAVTDTFDAAGTRSRIDDHALLAAAEAMGAIAVTALHQTG